MNEKILVAFDFSMNKPAMCILYKGKLHFTIWPLNMSKKQTELYEAYGVTAISRNLPELNPKQDSTSKIVWEHTRRSVSLSDMIVDAIVDFIEREVNQFNYELYIASEGLSFNSTGDAALNLATYKGVMLGKLYERLNHHIKRLCTYPPISIKSTAGCATKEKKSDKNSMIHAFIDNDDYETEFKRGLLLGKFTTPKKNFIKCVDDLCDSFWVLKTMIKKEGIDVSTPDE